VSMAVRRRVILTPDASAKGKALGFLIVTVIFSSASSALFATNVASDSRDSNDVCDTF